MTSIELDAELLSELIGEQLVLEGEGPHAYLAGIAFDGMSNEYTVEKTLVEFIENERTLDLTDDDVEQIVELLQ